MARWEEIGRQVMNATEDKVWFRIPYKNRVLINTYRFPTGSKFQSDYRDRLLSSEAEDGGVWIDGVIKRPSIRKLRESKILLDPKEPIITKVHPRWSRDRARQQARIDAYFPKQVQKILKESLSPKDYEEWFWNFGTPRQQWRGEEE